HAEIVEARRLGAGALVVVLSLGHQSVYLATGGAGAGPSTVNHLRYSVFQVPSRRTRSSVPLTNRTSPVFCRFTPIPYGSSLRLGPTMCRDGSCYTRPARIESSLLTASTCRCCNATRQSPHVTTATMIGGGVIC